MAIAALKSVKLWSPGQATHIIWPTNILLWKERRAHEAQESSPEGPPQIDSCVCVCQGGTATLAAAAAAACKLLVL